MSIFIKNSTFRSSRPVVDDHNGNFLLKMALQLKYNLISRKWWFKLLPLDVPFCIAKVTPLYVECDHTGLYQFLIIHWSTVLIACRFSCALQNKQNTPLNNVSDHIYGLIVWVWSLTLFKGMFRFSFAQNDFSLLAAIACFLVNREWDRKGADRISSSSLQTGLAFGQSGFSGHDVISTMPFNWTTV